MATATKTFKIGEYAKGGVITANVNGKVITIIGKDWDMTKGTRKSSDQSNAKEFTRGTIDSTESGANRKLQDFLCDLTTSYYADVITKWIETKIKIPRNINEW